MKRDMELVREILLQTEASPDVKGIAELDIENHSEDEVSYHVKIMAEAGLVTAIDLSTGMTFCWRPSGLTWQGHEFLDAIRNDTVWSKAKEIVTEKGGAIPFAVLQQLVIKIAASFFGL
jgi:hypothetical protein